MAQARATAGRSVVALCTGSTPSSRVPAPGADRITSCPPRACSRSDSPRSPDDDTCSSANPGPHRPPRPAARPSPGSRRRGRGRPARAGPRRECVRHGQQRPGGEQQPPAPLPRPVGEVDGAGTPEDRHQHCGIGPVGGRGGSGRGQQGDAGDHGNRSDREQRPPAEARSLPECATPTGPGAGGSPHPRRGVRPGGAGAFVDPAGWHSACPRRPRVPSFLGHDDEQRCSDAHRPLRPPAANRGCPARGLPARSHQPAAPPIRSRPRRRRAHLRHRHHARGGYGSARQRPVTALPLRLGGAGRAPPVRWRAGRNSSGSVTRQARLAK